MNTPPPDGDRLQALADAITMVTVQAECTRDEALMMISDRALVSHCTIYDIATAVLARTIRFGP